MHNVQQTKFKRFTWTNITEPDYSCREFLKKHFGFDDLAIQDSLSSSHRTKIENYTHYVYSAFIFPVYNRNSRELHHIKFHFFLGKDFLVTLSHGHFKSFRSFFHMYEENSDLRENFGSEGPEKILYEILYKLYTHILPMIDLFVGDCDLIEKNSFSKKMIAEIIEVRKNITLFRHLMQSHKDLLRKLVNTLQENKYITSRIMGTSYNDLVDYSKDIWNNLENLKERVEAIHQGNELQMHFVISDLMKTLTLISVLILPPILLAAMFGMNIIYSLPITNYKSGFFIIFGFILAIFSAMVLFFKKKRWM